MATLMQVRQAARTLGVHENTIRRWADQGLLNPIRLPSGVRRFHAEEIAQVHQKMMSGFAPLAEASDLTKLTPRPRGRSID